MGSDRAHARSSGTPLLRYRPRGLAGYRRQRPARTGTRSSGAGEDLAGREATGRRSASEIADLGLTRQVVFSQAGPDARWRPPVRAAGRGTPPAGRQTSAAADFVCFGGCPPPGGCRVGRPVRCPRLRWSGCVPRQPHAPRQPRPRRLWAALPSPANSSDVPLMPLERQRCSIDAVCSGWRARGRGRGRGERGVRGMRCGTAGGANPACRGTSFPRARGRSCRTPRRLPSSSEPARLAPAAAPRVPPSAALRDLPPRTARSARHVDRVRARCPC